jgi:curved DNA-binding protein CbpA
MDPYKILELPKNFTVEQLRSNYKKIALKVHPDKSNLGSDYLFKLVTVAYKTLLKEWEARQSDRQYNELRGGSQDYIMQQQQQPTQLKVNTGERFNVKNFNNVFDKYKLNDAADDGYGHWMTKSSVVREDIDVGNKLGKYNADMFNKVFESQPVTTDKKIIKYTEPEAVMSTKKMGFAELGVSKIQDYSGDNLTNKSLNYTDYKVAHTTNRLVSNLSENRKEYSNIGELEAERESISYKMSKSDLQAQARKKLKEQQREQQRLEAIRKRDQLIAKQYEKLNRVLLGI